ncbi:MAG: 50S ribosomal protein L6 [Candidatus Amesbacteria bacterium GW2011_GWB1_47_19]|nr:MAG: 50S ribosomal protein L6 [Candidatus Amesbacteria bacterium GW2011_GWA1_44_24]KKU32040.1 MAG: 50S ribosomal protein L6 [Candidatus Amesbacteria bacterium GW2011_GWC1_46_24]KKU67724.1 MAG: 50S ribosomal protein L6 [Candidatus Amesbacteria bacterium GW2011_GWB1_47_19]OGD06091.1 MAG: 50S ribosomal protein L6 [Candidatus Amesbacteria bacterium RIFOXYB1_FULL_47_13]HBC72318.1 50S ribosomal protein L6 [Candidatus Amesbacteria bacterium]
MSRIGKQLITIPPGVTVVLEGGKAKADGPKGKLEMTIPPGVKIKSEVGIITVLADENMSNMHGLARSLLFNMVKGVSEGWSKVVELSGTGYRAAVWGSDLQLALGFSHPVVVKAPQGVSFEVKDNKISVRGISKEMVGEIAAKIRNLRPADPYKAKGFKYEGEIIVRKAGKAAKTGAAGGK